MALVLLMSSAQVHARAMPLLELELGPAELLDLGLLADIARPEDMLRRLSEAHDDLELRTLDEARPRNGRYTRRFEAGPRGILEFGIQPTRDVILHEFLHYLIDRVRLRKHAAETIRVGKSFRRWAIERSLICQDASMLQPAQRVRHFRECLDGILFNAGEEVEIALFLLEHQAALHVGDLRRHAEYALGHFERAELGWRAFEARARTDFLANASDAGRFAEVEVRLGEVAPPLKRCALGLEAR